MSNRTITYFDSTLRDGAQGEGISFSLQDKINIVKLLDDLGVHFIEAGNPFSNPKDLEFFKSLQDMKLKNAKIVAFGSTRRKNIKAEEDDNLKALLLSAVDHVAIFGKSWKLHVDNVLKVSKDENLSMIEDTIKFLKKNNKKVFYDAEHFFDGYKEDRDYALDTIITAKNAGADQIVLCDTNGGTLTSEVIDIVKDVKNSIDSSLGIHLHNDIGQAVANSVAAIEAGAESVQGTLLGFGERCGNANLSTIIATLELKLRYFGIGDSKLKELTYACRRMAEIANIRLTSNTPFVGKSAFAHKAGMHVDGVRKLKESFEHINPEKVGNERRFLMSEVAGRSMVLEKIRKLNPSINKDNPLTSKVVNKIKEMEMQGYQYEGAEASLELLIRKELNIYKPFFDIDVFKTLTEQPFRKDLQVPATAVVRVNVNGEYEITAEEGKGPVNAFDKALRKALEIFYPSLKDFKLVDYKVRIIDSNRASSAVTRVIIESRDKNNIITTVGVSQDIIEASLLALVDAIEYKLILDEENKKEV